MRKFIACVCATALVSFVGAVDGVNSATVNLEEKLTINQPYTPPKYVNVGGNNKFVDWGMYASKVPTNKAGYITVTGKTASGDIVMLRLDIQNDSYSKDYNSLTKIICRNLWNCSEKFYVDAKDFGKAYSSTDLIFDTVAQYPWCDLGVANYNVKKTLIKGTNVTRLLYTVKYNQPVNSLKAEKNLAFNKCTGIVNNIKKQVNDYDKLMSLYSYLVNNIGYDNRNYNLNGIPQEYHNVYCINEGYGVCDGLSRVFSLMCNLLGIQCYGIVGKTNLGVAHMWNKVSLDGKWYCFDLAFACDSSHDSGFVDWSYFMRSDGMFASTHKQSVGSFVYPVAKDDDRSYFKTQKSFVYNKSDTVYLVRDKSELSDVIYSELKKKAKYSNLLLFNTKHSGYNLTKAVMDNLPKGSTLKSWDTKYNYFGMNSESIWLYVSWEKK